MLTSLTESHLKNMLNKHLCSKCNVNLQMSRKEALSQFIQQIHGRPVVVKLNSGADYRGDVSFLILKQIDNYPRYFNN